VNSLTPVSLGLYNLSHVPSRSHCTY